MQGCGSRVLARGWCRRHYEAWRRTGSPENIRTGPGICSERGCKRNTVGRGLCRYHYDRLWRAARADMHRQAKAGRICAFCQGPIPIERRAKAIYCSVRCKERSSASPRQWRAKLKRDFGLTEADYDRMLTEQRGKCAICKRTEPNGRGRWHIDHDHITGRVRGLLCNGCNAGLGHFRDDPAILRAAARYLTS